MAIIPSPLSEVNQVDGQSSQEVIAAQQKSIVSLQSQINNIQQEITGINFGLQGISRLIESDSVAEKIRLFQEEKKEKALSEAKLRKGKEDIVERRLESSISEPIQKLEPKFKSTFDGVTNALKLLFFGFLGAQTIQFFTRNIDFVQKGFSDIKSFVSKALKTVFDAVSFLKGGFDNVVNSIGGVIGKVREVIVNLTKSPVKTIAELFQNALGTIGQGATRAASTVGSGIGFTINLLGSFIQGGLKNINVNASSNTPAPSPATSQAQVSEVSATPAAVATKPLTSLIPPQESTAVAKELDIPQTSSTPLASLTSNSNITGNENKLQDRITVNPLNPPPIGGGNINNINNIQINPLTDTASSENNTQSPPSPPVSPPPTTQAQINSQQKPPPPLPIPVQSKPPNIIVASAPQANQNRRRRASSSGTDVPLISSFNSDNFYTLYSQLQYNVVM